MTLAFYLISALLCLAAAAYVCRKDIAYFIGSANAEQEAEARAREQMNARLADQKTTN